MATAMVAAMMTSRALLIDFTRAYAITNVLFDPPGFDWVYHQHPRKEDKGVFHTEVSIWSKKLFVIINY